jgi:hypothetical protein
MKKSSIAMLLMLMSTLFISCTKNEEMLTEEEACIRENYTITLDKYIKKIKKNPTDWRGAIHTSEFIYNEFNLLANHNSYTFDYDNEHLFNYQCNNNVSEMYGTTYTYDAEDNITSVKTNTYSSYDLVYNGQKIHVKGRIYHDPDQEIILELNSQNLVSKVSRMDSYSTFEYDLNGNLRTTKDFDLSGVLLNDYEITYDQNPNPFYGQLNSVYLAQFIELFYKSSSQGLQFLIIDGYDTFRFPYFKNNALNIKEKTNPSPYNLLFEREFTYDAQNYPTKIKFTYVGLHISDYEIEYN